MDISWWQPLVPVAASVVGGWALAMVTQQVQAMRETRRAQERARQEQERARLGREQEHYYKALDRTEDIFARCNALTNLVFEFSQQAVKIAGESPCRPDYSLPTVFITRFQSLLASITMSQRISYPGLVIDTQRIVKTVDSLDSAVHELWRIALDRDAGEPSPVNDKRVAENEARRAAIMAAYSTELGIMMNSMAKSLNKRAEKLGLRAEPVTVDWAGIKGPTADNVR